VWSTHYLRRRSVEVSLVNPRSIASNPLNAYIYTAPSGDDFEALKKSILTEGILEPLLITTEGILVSGHRRLAAALSLGLTEVPVLSRSFPDDASLSIALVESNRHRKKTFSEMMREAEVLHGAEDARAKERQQMGKAIAEDQVTLPEEEKGQARAKVADKLGVGERTYYMMTKIVAAGKDSPHVAAQIEKLDRGETTVFAVYKTVQKVDRDPLDFPLKVYDLWHFGGLNPKYGQPHPGAIPGDIIENLLWYYTDVGDLVVDPFAGGGVTLDVCKAWDRRCIASDIRPAREDILEWDVAKGLPAGSDGADLVFLDPPYANMLAELYSEDSASSFSMAEFIQFMQKVGISSRDALGPGGKVALIIMKQVYRLPEGVPYLDWPLILWKVFTSEGLRLIMRVINSWPSNIWVAPQVERAKDEKRMLPICGDLLIFDKP
jgi:hypothetical protein